jgi:hypothetical protein
MVEKKDSGQRTTKELREILALTLEECLPKTVEGLRGYRELGHSRGTTISKSSVSVFCFGYASANRNAVLCSQVISRKARENLAI